MNVFLFGLIGALLIPFFGVVCDDLTEKIAAPRLLPNDYKSAIGSVLASGAGAGAWYYWIVFAQNGWDQGLSIWEILAIILLMLLICLTGLILGRRARRTRQRFAGKVGLILGAAGTTLGFLDIAYFMYFVVKALFNRS